MFSKKSEKLQEEINSLKQELAYLKGLIQGSMGNKGVQTDTLQTDNKQKGDVKTTILGTTFNHLTTQDNNLGTTTNKDKKDIDAIELISLMNDFKESLKRKFKSLTDQEFFIFSVIYALEEQLGAASYKDIAEKAGLSESAVRDYIRNIIKKGVQLEKEKVNNKIVFLRISKELKSIVPLDSLISLRSPYNKNIVKESEVLDVANRL